MSVTFRDTDPRPLGPCACGGNGGRHRWGCEFYVAPRPVSNHYGRAQADIAERWRSPLLSNATAAQPIDAMERERDPAHERALENMRALDRDIAEIVAQAAPPAARHTIVSSPCSCGTVTEASFYPGETREVRCVSCDRPLYRATMRP